MNLYAILVTNCLRQVSGNSSAKSSQKESLKMIFDEESRDSGLPDASSAECSQLSSWQVPETASDKPSVCYKLVSDLKSK